ncbi:MAG TPA: FAD-dependent oxidoreductase [Trebonia sp.]|jgi:NADPH-dependent 2,4-dienoyl-CoA reductase/sulfur reductase-like enzyme
MTNHVAIVGAGLGGLRAAEQLRAAGHAGPITVVGAEPHMPYNRPPLSKELLAHELADAEAAPGADADDLAVLHKQVAFRQRASVADVTFRLGVPVTTADLGTGGVGGGELVLADGGTVRFDGLVAAAGLRPRHLNVPGPAGPGSGRHVLRTLDDCASLRAGLRAALATARDQGAPAARDRSSPASQSAPRPGGRAAVAVEGLARPHVVVVGAGFVGCEVACTALSLGCDVTVVEPIGPPMIRVLGEQVAQAIQRAHERAGMSFVIGQGVIGYVGEDRVTGVVLDGGTGAGAAGGPAAEALTPAGPAPVGAVLPADLVVEAIGSIPNTEWLDGNGLDLTDGVLCDNTLSAVTNGRPGAPVTVVGDLARFPNPLLDDVPRRVEHWSMPTDTARRAAATLHARMAGDQVDPNPFRPLPYFWSDQGELRLQSFGSPQLADDVVIAEGDPADLDHGLLATYHRGGRLVGSLAVNLPPSRYRELREALR